MTDKEAGTPAADEAGTAAADEAETSAADDATTPSPDEAFAVLGSETRVRILQALGAAGTPLSFSELRDAVGVADSGQFNYHLDRLTDHFVAHTDAGYELSRAGGRVVEAVLSGAVTDAPVLEPTRVGYPCHFCGAPVEAAVREEHVELYCTECSGAYAETSSPGAAAHENPAGYLGYYPLPPAGLKGRTPDEVVRAAFVWGHLELVAASSGVCPRCAATVERSGRVCADHDAADGLCRACGRRYAVAVDLQCSNCIYDESGTATAGLAGTSDLLAFLAARGLNPVAPSPESLPAVSRILNDYDETVHSVDPLSARFTFSDGEDALALTVDADLTVVDATVS